MTGVARAAHLLERDGELADLVGLEAQSRAGRGAAAVIVGPPGIGKTDLLDALHGHAAGRGARSLRARGSRRRAERDARDARDALALPARTQFRTVSTLVSRLAGCSTRSIRSGHAAAAA